MLERARLIGTIKKVVDDIRPVRTQPTPALREQLVVTQPRLLEFLMGKDPDMSFVTPPPQTIDLGEMSTHLAKIEDQRGREVVYDREYETEGELTFFYYRLTGQIGYSISNDGLIDQVTPKDRNNILRGRAPFMHVHTHDEVSLPTALFDYDELITEHQSGIGRRMYTCVVACPGLQILSLPSVRTPVYPARTVMKMLDEQSEKDDQEDNRYESELLAQRHRVEEIGKQLVARQPEKVEDIAEKVEHVKRRLYQRSVRIGNELIWARNLSFIEDMKLLTYGSCDYQHFRRLSREDLILIANGYLPRSFTLTTK